MGRVSTLNRISFLIFRHSTPNSLDNNKMFLSVEQLQNVHIKSGSNCAIKQLMVTEGLIVCQIEGDSLKWIELSGIKGNTEFVYEGEVYAHTNGQIKIVLNNEHITSVFGKLRRDGEEIASIHVYMRLTTNL
uniref:ORF132 n=1 Tax=Cydia pomonella granulosis virus TaxID=28289 RepID=A0A5B8GQ18_GVCP|nr:ORF132 [Cydia pomonella granulovirus]